MLGSYSILLLFVFVSGWVCISYAQFPCQNDWSTSDLNRTVGLTIVTHRNESGHWITNFSADNISKRQPKKWKVEVKHTLTCQGELQGSHIQGAIIVPPVQPMNYKLFPGVGFYKYHEEELKFDEAHTICLKEGGHLAIIDSKEEVDVLISLFSKVQALIGVHDRVKEGEFVTIFGGPLQYTKWANNQPDNDQGNEDCIAIKNTGLLNDVPCDHKLPFICEYDLEWAH